MRNGKKRRAWAARRCSRNEAACQKEDARQQNCSQFEANWRARLGKKHLALGCLWSRGSLRSAYQHFRDLLSPASCGAFPYYINPLLASYLIGPSFGLGIVLSTCAVGESAQPLEFFAITADW